MATLDLDGNTGNTSFTTSYTEGQPGVRIARNPGVQNLGTQKIQRVEIEIRNAATGDVLTVPADLHPEIRRNFGNGGTTLILGGGGGNGDETNRLLDLLNAVRFSSTGEGRTGTKTIAVKAVISDNNDDGEVTLINYTAVNDQPVADNDTGMTNENTPISIAVRENDTDAEGDALTVTAASVQSGRGTASVNDAGTRVVYDPGSAYDNLNVGDSATVVVSYTISDGNGGTDNGRVTITVNGRNDAPTAGDDSAAATEDGAVVNGSVAGNDDDVDDGATLTYALAGAAPAALTFNGDGSYSFDPSNTAYQSLAAGEKVDVTADYTVTDENGATAMATLTITVTGVNDDPDAQNDTATVVEDTAETAMGNVLDNDDDVEGDMLVVTNPGTMQGQFGILVLQSDGKYTYTANSDQFDTLPGDREDVFTYSVSDGMNGTDSATLTITLDEGGDNITAAPGTSGKDMRDFSSAGERDDTFNGNAGDDTISGGGGSDTLNGGSGNDTINGGSGRDKLFGDAGTDTINGGEGDDTIDGGTGNDRMTGGGGRDDFVFQSGNGADVITDFMVGEDQLVLNGVGIRSRAVRDTNGDNVQDLVLTLNSGGGTITLLGLGAQNPSDEALRAENGNTPQSPPSMGPMGPAGSTASFAPSMFMEVYI